MHYVRFRRGQNVHFGILDGDIIKILSGSFLDPASKLTEAEVPANQVALLAPVIPGKIVCVGLNYSKHAAELAHTVPEDPVIFLKPVTSLADPAGEIVYPAMSQRVDYEAELVAVIGKTLKNASEAEAGAGIFGYTCGNDVTARDLQTKDGQWTRAKSFDTFCPLGPAVVTDLDPRNLQIRLWLNGSLKQDSNTRYLITPVAKLVSYISQIMTLNPGDVVMTGTPEGVGPMEPGDEVAVAIQGIGRLINRVVR